MVKLIIEVECNKKAECCGPCDYVTKPGQGYCSLFNEWLEPRGRGHERCDECWEKEEVT